MSEYDLLIFTVYIIVVVSTLFRAINAVGEQLQIRFDEFTWNRQLAEYKLNKILDINFELKERYQLEDFKNLTTIIKNLSPNFDMYINWEQSCFIDLEGNSQRLIRLPPNMNAEILKPQVESVIAANKSLKEKLSTEKTLKQEPVSGNLALVYPLIDAGQLKAKAKTRKPLVIQLRFVLRITTPQQGKEATATAQSFVLYCPLRIKRLGWTAALPWNIRP
jgi:hypothetical protein